MTAPILPVVRPQPESVGDGRHPPRRNRPKSERTIVPDDDGGDGSEDETEKPSVPPPAGPGHVDVVA